MKDRKHVAAREVEKLIEAGGGSRFEARGRLFAAGDGPGRWFRC